MASIKFFTFRPIERINGKLDSTLASARYRTIIPALQLARRGHQLGLDMIPIGATGRIDPARVPEEIVVFSKTLSSTAVALARDLRALGRTVVFDQCDNYFNHAHHGTGLREFAVDLSRLSTYVVTSTEQLREQILENTGVDALIVSDPVEGRYGPAAFRPAGPRTRLLWFGHGSNWSSLASVIPELAALSAELPLELLVITGPTPEIVDSMQGLQASYGATLPLALRQWSADAVWAALAQCDIVIIPSHATEFFSAKSPNRLAEALWAGRHVVAHPVPSYLPFSGFAHIGDSIADGIRAAIAAPGVIEARIGAGQDYVRLHHSPWAIGNSWEQALGIDNSQRPLRLQLACDQRILPGYVNIDHVDALNDARPDMVCDPGQLVPFADASVDEIISRHMRAIDTTSQDAVLGECLRVLKPGGRLVLECTHTELATHLSTTLAELGIRDAKIGKAEGFTGIVLIGMKQNPAHA